jgi:HSP20 family protein
MLTLWDPFAELGRLHTGLLGRAWHGTEPAFRPSVDIVEEEKAYLVKADLAGMKPEDIKIEVKNNVLTVSGERKLEKKEEGEDGYRRIEREYGSFTRSFTLPETAEGDNIDASYKDGVLTVTIPKRAEPEPRQIKVETH